LPAASGAANVFGAACAAAGAAGCSFFVQAANDNKMIAPIIRTNSRLLALSQLRDKSNISILQTLRFIKLTDCDRIAT
jgi:hypothetical protein